MGSEKKVPEEKRILMGDFPVRPGDWVIMPLECNGEEYPCLGEVLYVGSRNPDPGISIRLTTPEEFDSHTGGAHSGVRLSRYDSMWAEIRFVKPGCSDGVIKRFHTYKLKEMLEKNEIGLISVTNHFESLLDFLRNVRKEGE